MADTQSCSVTTTCCLHNTVYIFRGIALAILPLLLHKVTEFSGIAATRPGDAFAVVTPKGSDSLRSNLKGSGRA
jgi:hypothetical protein